MHKRGLCGRAVSVCLARSCIESKRLKIIFKTFSPSGSYTILVFCAPNGLAIFRRGPPPLLYSESVKCRGYEKMRFLTNISLYLVNDAKYGDSYYGSRIGNCTLSFERYHFQWSWVTQISRSRCFILVGCHGWLMGSWYTPRTSFHSNTLIHYSEKLRTHNSTYPQTSLVESPGENPIPVVCSDSSVSAWYGTALPRRDTSVDHWSRCSVSTQIGEHVDTHRAVNSLIHTRRPGITSGGRTCLEHPAS